MNPTTFLIALAALSIGTYVMRLAGVKVGAALALRGRRRALVGADGPTAEAMDDPTGGASFVNETTTSANDADEPTSRVTAWMDKATVVLIGAVFATTAIFDGQDIADPARLIGVGVGVLAAVLRVPMLVCVIVAMAVCAGIRMTGIL